MARLTGFGVVIAAAVFAGGLTAYQASDAPAGAAASPAKEGVAERPQEPALGEAPRLVNERVLFRADDVSWVNTNKIASCPMGRLTPDGRRLLYTRVRESAEEQPAEPSYDLLLRDVETGADVRVPVPPYPDGFEDIHIRFNPFDPTGERMALMAVHGPGGTEVVIFDVAKGNVTPTGIKAGFALARFDRTGRQLVGVEGGEMFVAALPSLERTKLDFGAPGYYFPNSICPTADVVCIYAVKRVPGRRRPMQAIFLYDLKAARKIADLPTHPENSQLDDLETQWTPDGRYICYYDRADGPQGRVSGTRIWDRVAGKEQAFVEDTAPMGAGPGGSYIVLVRTLEDDRRPILYDAAGGRLWELADASTRLIHAAGGKIAYLKMLPDGKMVVCVAEISMPAASE